MHIAHGLMRTIVGWLQLYAFNRCQVFCWDGGAHSIGTCTYFSPIFCCKVVISFCVMSMASCTFMISSLFCVNPHSSRASLARIMSHPNINIQILHHFEHFRPHAMHFRILQICERWWWWWWLLRHLFFLFFPLSVCLWSVPFPVAPAFKCEKSNAYRRRWPWPCLSNDIKQQIQQHRMANI